MAKYSADIEIAVRGGQQINNTIRDLNRLNNSINLVTKRAKLLEGRGFNVASIENYSRAVAKAERAVNKAAAGTDLERRAITQLVTAMELENKARSRRNFLIAQEVASRRQVIATANAGVGIQGPALPRYMMTGPSSPIGGGLRGRGGGGRGGAAGGIGSRLGGAVSGSIIGGAFPLLFGQGAGAAAGGAIGGLVGGLAGPGGSFAGSLLGTLLGDIASQGAKVKELAADIGFSADQTKRLENAFALAGQEADKFEAATQNIRGLGLSIDDQADAITLAANLTETYGGKIDKVAAAYANFVEKGKVGIADINQFTSQGIPILDALERKYKTNRDGILRMAKDGEISAQALSDALIAIGNSSDTAVKKTVTGWDKAWKDIKDGGSLLAQAVGVYFNVLTGSAASSTSSIAEYFAAMFKNIVQNSIDATAAVARQIANLARFAANISATAELGGLNIGATVSKNIAKTIEEAARNYDAQLQAIALPQPGKVGAITVPGQAPPPGGGGGGGKDRSKQIFEETLRLQNQIREAYLDQAKAAAEVTEFSQGEAAAIALQLSKFNDIAKVREEILNTERSVALVSAESGEQAALINQLYDRKLQILQAQNRLEQQQLQRKSSELAVEKELAAVQRQRELVAATQDIRRQRFSTELDIAAFTTSAEEIENQRLALEQNFRWTDQTREAYEKIEDLKIKLAKQDLDKATRDSLQLDLENQQAKLALIEKELALLDQVEQKQLRLQQFFATYGQLIQSVSGEIANAVTFGISEMVRGTKTAEQVFSEFLNAVGAALLQTAQQMIATYIAIGLAKAFAGFGGGGGGNSATALGINPNVAAYAPLANGGPTRAGTPYLVGERGPELFVPGNSGGVMSNSDLRSAMGSAPGSSGGSPVLNMSFETTRIGDTEYVSRDQLEQAMAATRRQAANDGARRGMTMTLDRIQQSPQTRSRIGIRR